MPCFLFLFLVWKGIHPLVVLIFIARLCLLLGAHRNKCLLSPWSCCVKKYATRSFWLTFNLDWRSPSNDIALQTKLFNFCIFLKMGSRAGNLFKTRFGAVSHDWYESYGTKKQSIQNPFQYPTQNLFLWWLLILLKSLLTLNIMSFKWLFCFFVTWKRSFLRTFVKVWEKTLCWRGPPSKTHHKSFEVGGF